MRVKQSGMRALILVLPYAFSAPVLAKPSEVAHGAACSPARPAPASRFEVALARVTLEVTTNDIARGHALNGGLP